MATREVMPVIEDNRTSVTWPAGSDKHRINLKELKKSILACVTLSVTFDDIAYKTTNIWVLGICRENAP